MKHNNGNIDKGQNYKERQSSNSKKSIFSDAG